MCKLFPLLFTMTHPFPKQLDSQKESWHRQRGNGALNLPPPHSWTERLFLLSSLCCTYKSDSIFTLSAKSCPATSILLYNLSNSPSYSLYVDECKPLARYLQCCPRPIHPLESPHPTIPVRHSTLTQTFQLQATDHPQLLHPQWRTSAPPCRASSHGNCQGVRARRKQEKLLFPSS